jgi:hypothetical protein
LLSPRVEIQRTLARARGRFAEARWDTHEHLSELGNRLQALRGEHSRVSTATRERLAYAWWHVRESLSELAERLQAFRAAHGRVSTAARERLAYAWWHVRESSSELAGRLQAFRAEHRRVSTVAALGLLLGLGLAGTAAAILANGGERDVTGVEYTSRYVTVTGPGGTQTYAVTVTTKDVKRKVVQSQVVTRPGRLRTLRETIGLPGPIQVEPGPTKTVAGPTKTVSVTVTGPGQTVTQVQVVTETVTVTNEVTVTDSD